VERHGFAKFWPIDPVVLTKVDWDYMKGLNCREYFQLEQLQSVLTPWVDAQDLLVVTMRRNELSSAALNALCENDGKLRKF